MRVSGWLGSGVGSGLACPRDHAPFGDGQRCVQPAGAGAGVVLGQATAAEVEGKPLSVGNVDDGCVPALNLDVVEDVPELGEAVFGIETQRTSPCGQQGCQFGVVVSTRCADREQSTGTQDSPRLAQGRHRIGQVVQHPQCRGTVEGVVRKGQADRVGPHGGAGSVDDVAGVVDDNGADVVGGQQSCQRAIAPTDVGDESVTLLGEAAGHVGVNVLSCGEPAGRQLIGGEAAGIVVVVAGQRVADGCVVRSWRAHAASVLDGDRDVPCGRAGAGASVHAGRVEDGGVAQGGVDGQAAQVAAAADVAAGGVDFVENAGGAQVAGGQAEDQSGPAVADRLGVQRGAVGDEVMNADPALPETGTGEAG